MRGILRGMLARTLPKTTSSATTSAIGAAGEARAADHLSRHGLQLLAQNFRVKGGEIDLICRDGDTTVFVEVRLRSHSNYGGAAASITPAKQRRIILAARHWLQKHGETPCRFDCVLIDDERLEWLQDAFSAD